jgi:hypothetical protein
VLKPRAMKAHRGVEVKLRLYHTSVSGHLRGTALCPVEVAPLPAPRYLLDWILLGPLGVLYEVQKRQMNACSENETPAIQLVKTKLMHDTICASD